MLGWGGCKGISRLKLIKTSRIQIILQLVLKLLELGKLRQRVVSGFPRIVLGGLD